MGSYGAEFLKRRPGNETATGRALDSAEAMSPLQDMTMRFMDAVNNALVFTAFWLNEETPGKVILTTDFGPDEPIEADLTFLAKLRAARDISRLAVIEESKRRGLMAEDYDAEADLKQLELEVELLKDITPIIPGQTDPSEEGSQPDKPTEVKEV